MCNPVFIPGLRLVLYFLFVCLVTAPVSADGAEENRGLFQVNSASTELFDDEYTLDAQLDIHLCSGAQEALENGVPLAIGMHVQVYQSNKWLWDVIVKEFRIERQLQYHALSRRYLVRNLLTGESLSFALLDDATRELGRVTEEPITDLMGMLEGDETYFVRLRGYLDIETLPTPVRLMAYVSSEWDMDSKWYTWPLQR